MRLEQECSEKVDAVVGRTVDHRRTGTDDTLFNSADELEDRLVELLATPALLVRRQRWLDAASELKGSLPVAQLAVRLAAGSPAVKTVGGYPVLVGVGLAGRRSPSDHVDDVVAALRADRLPPTRGALRLLGRALGAGGGQNLRPASLPDIERLAAAGDTLEPGALRVLLGLVKAGRFELAERLGADVSRLSLRAKSTDVAWIDGRAKVAVTASVPVSPSLVADLRAAGVDPGELFAGATARLGLRNRLTTSIYAIAATEQAVLVGADSARVTVTADLDAPTADGGGPLPRGIYQVVCEVVGVGWAPVLQSLLVGSCDLSAVFDDCLVNLRDNGDAGLHLDVDTASRSLLGRLSPRGATIAEDARGSLLTLPVPDLATHRSGSLDVHVVLGGLPFPGTLVLDEPVRIECFVSGLPGAVEVKTQVGSGRATSTDCELVTHMDGTFAVQKLRPENKIDLSPTVASALTPTKTTKVTPPGEGEQTPSAGGGTGTEQAGIRRLEASGRARRPARRPAARHTEAGAWQPGRGAGSAQGRQAGSGMKP